MLAGARAWAGSPNPAGPKSGILERIDGPKRSSPQTTGRLNACETPELSLLGGELRRSGGGTCAITGVQDTLGLWEALAQEATHWAQP